MTSLAWHPDNRANRRPFPDSADVRPRQLGHRRSAFRAQSLSIRHFGHFPVVFSAFLHID
jgi:hypothetical protein